MAGADGAHDQQRGHRDAGTCGAWHRLCGMQQLAVGLAWVARVARTSAGAQEWSGSERSAVHVALVPCGLHGAHWGLPMWALYVSMRIEVRVLKLA